MINLKKIGTLTTLVAGISLAGCTNTVSHNVTRDGTIENSSDVIFPKLDKAWQKDGEFPNAENLAKIRPGMGKDELYQLIGRPHFSETQHAHEWDYIMKFYQPDNSVKICQYKVVFDKDYKAQQFYWLPADCPPQPEKPVVVAPVVVAPPVVIAPITEKISLSADALFAFDKWQPNDMKPKGRAELDELADKLVAYEKQGDSRVMITGYTDMLGSDKYNLNLSQLRAQTVRQYLISKGVSASTVTAAGAGKADPVKQCDPALNRAELINCLQPNRRVEVAVSVSQPVTVVK